MNTNNPLTIVVFGATGDLYQKKLSSALFSLFSSGLLPQDFSVIGFARKPLADQEFREFTREAIVGKKAYDAEKMAGLDNFLTHVKYKQGDLENLQSFMDLGQMLGADDEAMGICTNKLFYLAVPPSLYAPIFKNIHDSGLTIPCAPGVEDREAAWTRVLVEKPFGKDLADAKHLDMMLGELFDESQIFRIDHYLAKETMQKILEFRFNHGAFEPIWNKENIDKVRINFYEAEGVNGRGEFYDGVGALRDVGQNHMLQMLALIAMEDPGGQEPEKIRNARKAVLEKADLLPDQEIVRGQYAGYLEEKDVKSGSDTETFFRAALGVDNDRFHGVPFILESGKALDRSEVYIEVCFKGANACLRFPISSDEGVKQDAYEKVFYDCILGDQTLFVTTAEIMAEWSLIADIINKWQKIPLVVYRPGSKPEEIK